MIVGLWVENKKTRAREFGAAGKRLKKEYRYFHQQLDGTVIDPAECCCIPDFVNGEWGWQLACPIDDHKARAQMAQWDWDEPRQVKVVSRKAKVAACNAISQGRRPRDPGVTGARISA